MTCLISIDRYRSTGAVRRRIDAPDGTRFWEDCAFRAPDTLVAYLDNGTVEVWNVRTNRRVGVVRRWARYSPAGPKWSIGLLLPVTEEEPQGEWFVRLLDTRTGAYFKPPVPPGFWGATVSADGKTLAGASVREDFEFSLYDVESGRELRSLPLPPGFCSIYLFSPDGRWLVAGMRDGSVFWWDVRPGSPDKPMGLRGASGENRGSLQCSFFGLSPDGRLVAQPGDFGCLRLWDLRTGTVSRTIALPGRRGLAAAFFPDGKTLATAAHNQVWLLDPDTGAVKRSLGQQDASVLAVSVSPDGSLVATSNENGKLCVWDAATGNAVSAFTDATLKKPYLVRTVTFSPDGKTIAVPIDSMEERVGRVNLVEARTGRLVARLDGPEGYVRAAVFSPDGHTVAAPVTRIVGTPNGDGANVSRTHNVWTTYDLSTGAIEKSLRSVTCEWGTVLWNVKTGAIVESVPGAAEDWCAAFTRDGKSLMVGGRDRIMRMLDAKSGRLLRTLGPQDDWVQSLALSPDERTLITQDSSGALCLWDLASGRLLARLMAIAPEESRAGFSRIATPNGIREVGIRASDAPLNMDALSPDGRLVAGRDGHNTLCLWDATSGALRRAVGQFYYQMNSVAFSPNGRLLAGADVWVRFSVWDLLSGRKVYEGRRPPASVPSCVVFSPDGRTMAVGLRPLGYGWTWFDESKWQPMHVQLVDTTTWKETSTWLAGHGELRALAFSPDGRRLAGAFSAFGYATPTEMATHLIAPESRYDRGAAVIWDVTTGQAVHTFVDEGDDHLVTFSPDGKRLAAGAWDRKIRLYDLEAGKLLYTLSLDAPPRSMAFSSDGARLYTIDMAQAGTEWDVASGRRTGCMPPPIPSPAAMEVLPAPWLAVTPEGYYTCSEGADDHLKWVLPGNTAVPVYQYEETFRRHDLVEKALVGEAIMDAPLPVDRVPPVCSFVAPKDGETVRGDTVHVVLEASAAGAVKDVRFYVNGFGVPDAVAKPLFIRSKALVAGAKPLFIRSKPIPPSHTRVTTLTADLKLPSGEKDVTIQAVVVDASGLKSERTQVSVHRTDAGELTGELYLLAIGVSRYRNPNYDLSFAADDARSIGESLKAQEGRNYAGLHVTVLTDREASLPGIRDALQGLKTARPSDTVVVFLSGHGVQKDGLCYFAPWGAVLTDIEGTCIPWTEIVQALSQVNARKVLLADACHSGGKLYQAQATNDQLMAASALPRTGILMLTSSNGEELSYEDREQGHGVFTAALLEAMSGRADADKDGTVTLFELMSYTPKRVTELTRGGQHPMVPRLEDFDTQTPLLKLG